MFIRLLFLFTLVPIIEIYTLLEIGQLIGLGATILLIMATGVAGAYLARTQGLDAVRRIQDEMAAGRIPGATLIDGAMILVGGVLLLTPGFCTDLLGFSLLVPLPRKILRQWLTLWFQKQLEKGNIQIYRG